MKLFKIVEQEAWVGNKLKLASNDKSFIHFAEQDDVRRIAAKFFADCTKVLVLVVDTDKLVGSLVQECNPGGRRKYFHLYDGHIPKDAVMDRFWVEIPGTCSS